MSAKLKRFFLALSVVLFVGQSVVRAQGTEAEMKRLIDIGKYEEALAMGQRILAQDPKNDKIDYLMGRAYFETERVNEASAWFTKGQGHSSRNPMNFAGGGAVAANQDNFEKAKLELDKAAGLNVKNDPKTFLAIAEAYMAYTTTDKAKAQPFLKEAELYLYKVQKLSPNDAESYVLLGKLYGLQGVEELEQGMYEKAIEKDPKYIFGYFRLGQLFKKQSKFQEAADMFQKAIALDPGYGPVYRAMAEMWILAKKYDKAEENINKYLEIMGGDKGSRIIQITIYFLGDQFDKTIEIGEKVIIDTNSTLVKRLLAYSYVKKTPPDAAKSLQWFNAYWEAVKTNPKAIIASDYEFYGKAFQLQGNDVEAVKNYELSIELEKAKGDQGKPNYELYNSVAEMYKEKKDTIKRIYYLRKFVQSNTSGKYQLKENFALGQAYFQVKDFVHADSVFEVMTQKMTDLHIGYSWRGRSNAAQDPGSKMGKALPYYEKVIELLGSDAEKIAKYKADYITAMRYKGAYLATVLEKFAESRPFWEKILELDPADVDAKNGLEYVKSKGG